MVKVETALGFNILTVLLTCCARAKHEVNACQFGTRSLLILGETHQSPTLGPKIAPKGGYFCEG